MLPKPISNFENLRDLNTIVKLKRIQKWVTYFCTQPLSEQKRESNALVLFIISRSI